MQIARDKDGTLRLFDTIPVKHEEGYWTSPRGYYDIELNSSLFPEVTWENSPKKVELVVEDFVEKACEWLSKTLYIHTEEIEDKHWNEIKTFDWVTSDYDSVEEFIEEFKKVMKANV